jgi:phosphoserine phosphatase RsbU/P
LLWEGVPNPGIGFAQPSIVPDDPDFFCRSRRCEVPALGEFVRRVQNSTPLPPGLPMSRSTPAFDRLLQLSAFDGDSAAALRVLHGHFTASMPSCSLALVQIGGLEPGHCRLAGLIDAQGHERIANTDPLGQRVNTLQFGDSLSCRLFGAGELTALVLDEQETASAFAQALDSPAVVLGIPIANAGTVAHWLLFASKDVCAFDGTDLHAVMIESNLAANLIIRPLVTRALRDESTRHRRAIESMADIQRLLLPDQPTILGLEHAVHWQPAETAAGDYYDLANLTRHAPADFPRDRYDIWAITLADVSGHGAAAAMEAAQFDAILRTYQGKEEDGPAGALTYANRFFFSRRQRQHFLTATALLFRPDLSRATHVSAGHPPLLHRHGRVVIERDSGQQIPLGVLRDHEWSNAHFDVASGDIIVMYTDGIVEARNASGEMFGVERMRSLVAEGPEDPAELLKLLCAALFEHQDSLVGVDDQTLIVLRITA